MVLYCSAHETAVLRMLAHKMKYHHDEEMVFITTVGTYPFCDKNRDFSFVYKKVIEFNTALGKKFTDKEQIINSIVTTLDKLFFENGFTLHDFSKIYITEDIYHPYSIYFESKNVNYTAIEISPNSFENKRTFCIENHLYARSKEYFELAQELGAFCATGKNCELRVFDGESTNFDNQVISETIYNYQLTISSLEQSDLNMCINLYGMPANIPNNEPFMMALTNSRGFTEGNCPGITCEQIPRIYQKMFDYYFSDKDKIFIKPHPNSQGINYLQFFDEQQILDEKFLVDLIPFVENVKLDTVVNVASTASVLLKKYCNENISLGVSFFEFSLQISKLYGAFCFIRENEINISKIYTIDVCKEQIEQFLNFCFPDIKIKVEEWSEKKEVDENSLILSNRLDLLRNDLLEIVLDIESTHANILVLSDVGIARWARKQNISNQVYILEIAEWIKKLDVREKETLFFISQKVKEDSVCKEFTLKHSRNFVQLKGCKFRSDARICVFGGNCVRWMVEPLRKKFEVTYLPWISPLSIASKSIGSVDNSEFPNNITNEIEFQKNISKWLFNTDYLFLDLETLRYDLLGYRETYFTDTRAFRNLEFYKNNENEIKVISALESDEKFIEEKLEVFVDLLLSIYKPENIILIRHGKAINSYISDHIIRNWKIDTYNNFIDKWENYILNKTNCKNIDIWKRYMSKYGDNAAFFEKIFYEDVVWNAISIIANEKLYSVNEADFSLRLMRYMKFYDFAVFRKQANFFLDRSDSVEAFVLKTSKAFIENNFDILVEIKSKNNSCLNNVFRDYCLLDTNARQAYDEICAIEDSSFLESDINFKFAFKYQFEILKILEVKLKDYISDNLEVSLDVNSKNIYEIFLLVRHFHNKTLSKNNCLSLLYSLNALTKRTLIDVWGSCISREIFNMNFSFFKVNIYLMRNSIIHTGLPPVEIEEGLLSLEHFTNEWVYRNCSSEWNRTCGDRLNSSDAKWIVIDLHDVFYPNYYYKNEKNIFCKAFDLNFMPFYSFIEKDIYAFDYSDEKYDDAFFRDAVQSSIKILREKYGSNVIVIDTIWKKYYLDEQRYVQKFSISDEENKSIDRKNHIARMLSNYLVENLNCYHITFLQEFLADELWHGGEISLSHYELYFYEEAYSVIEDIVRRQPEQREYTSVRVQTRIRRIKELSVHKNNHKYLLSIYDTYLDAILVELDNILIDKYEDVIKYIYQKEYKNAEQMLNNFNFESNNATELKIAMYKVHQFL